MCHNIPSSQLDSIPVELSLSRITKMSNNSYTEMLKESSQRFLAHHKTGSTDFSNFELIFSRFLQTSPDPPLEFLWFHSAASFHTSRQNPLHRIKQLFQTIVSSSGFCNGTKKIAALAPVVLELYWLSVLDRGVGLGDFIDGVVGYVSVCVRSEGDESGDSELGLSCCFGDLVSVWMVDKVDRESAFFPVCGGGVVGEGCSVGCLSGVVMCEVLLLGMCLKIGAKGSSRREMERSLTEWAVHVITGFRSFYFLDTLLKILMETDSPITPILQNYEDRIFLHGVLLDAIMEVQYSFFNPNSEVHLPWHQLQTLAMTFLFVVDDAIRTARENCDDPKAFQYSNAFLESGLPSLLIKWVTNQTGMNRKFGTPSDSTPISLIKWLLSVDDHGVNVFDHTSKLYAKAVLCKSREGYKFLHMSHECKDVDSNISIHSDERGNGLFSVDVEMADTVDNDLVSASRKNLESDGRRKRKEERPDIGDRQVKYTKCLFHEGVSLS